MRQVLLWLSILLLLFFGVSFTVLNSNHVLIHYYLGEKELPLSILLLATFLAGMILSGMLMTIVLLKCRYQKRQLERQMKLLRQELDNLRSLPVEE